MRVYFTGLTEIRGLAALAVIFHHVELFKEREGLPTLYNTFLNTFISGLGKNGVYLFFVLSGFLITFLLKEEQRKYQKIEIGKFYVRRILRIWPLYYIVVGLSFFIFPAVVNLNPDFFGDNYYFELVSGLENNFYKKILFFLLFFPNLALIIFDPVAGAAQSWSVGVEEQFYLIWPVILNSIKRNLFLILVGVMLTKAILILVLFGLSALTKQPVFGVMLAFLNGFKIELMALGGMGAYFMQKGTVQAIASKLKKYHVVLLFTATICGMVLGWNYFLLSCLFLFIILINTFPHLNIVKNRLLYFLGEISYGIYMYHPLCMFFAFCLCRWLVGLNVVVSFSILFYLLTIGFTILVSYLSFNFLEKRFLQRKVKYEIINSGK